MSYNFCYRIPLLVVLLSTPALATRIQNFSQAKNMSIKINSDIPGDFYCGCKITWQGKKGIIDLKSCGYKIRKNKNRANQLEWEHVVPIWQLGHQLQCWQNGGRKNCAKDPVFRFMESDMHNLQPTIGEINGDRGNFMYNQWNDITDQYGQCKMKVNFKDKIVEPPVRARGSIARIYFYMRDRYHLNLPSSQIQLFTLWNKIYPVTIWECERDKRIAKIQGNHNPYVERACKTKIN